MTASCSATREPFRRPQVGGVVRLALAAVCLGVGSAEGRDEGEMPRITPNQSASIAALPSPDATRTPNTDGTNPVMDGPPVEGAGTPSRSAGGRTEATTDGLDRSLTLTRSQRRHAEASGGELTAFRSPRAGSLEDVPWYRSGLGALGIVLAGIAFAAWAVRRWVPTMRGGEVGVLRVVGRAALSPKHSVALVSLGRRFVMVGLAGDRVTPICEVTDPEEVAELTLRTGMPSECPERRFEAELASEEDRYVESRVEAVEPTHGSSRTRRVPAMAPLHAILKRLRTLQTK